MPLSRIQIDILRLLAAHRNLESFVAGATALNQDAPRFSGDIDIFHDREEGVARASDADTVLLAAHGFEIEWLRREPGIHAAMARRGGERMRLEWVRDSDYRVLFLSGDIPVQPDPAKLTSYTAHAGRRGGYWPSSPEISSMMVREPARNASPKSR